MTHDIEVLARATSIHEELEQLKKGTDLYKIRDKGVRGLKSYKRRYRLDVADLRITYTPSKSAAKKAGCAGRSGSEFINISELAEVRSGHNTDTFNHCVKEAGSSNSEPKVEQTTLPKEKCFSLIFRDTHYSLDLVAESQSIRDTWVDVLSHMIVTIKSLGEQKEYELFLKKQFQTADKDNNGSLTFSECKGLIEQLNIKMEKEELKKFFDLANVNKSKGREEEALDQSEFIAFYYSLMKRPELDEVFVRYTKNNPDGRMTIEDLMKFQREEQKNELLEEECHKIIEAFEPKPGQKTLSMEGFAHFMIFSEMQEITDSVHTSSIYQDMTQPLSHYWLASSHNTYLTGNQVTGDSSVDGYINALKRGCKCVELDCWDGDDGEPIIYHGWTLTSKILFKEVLSDAIRPYAFYTSDFPLILSIENHCSLEQQDKMADHMKNIFKDMLFLDKVDDNADALPSPEALKKKILIKGKRLPPGKTENDEIDDVDGDEDDDERDEAKKTTSKKISQKFSDCINYIHAVHFHSFEESKSSAKYYHMSSFGESKATKFAEDPEKFSREFVNYNTRQISRIYPSGKRQDSSNLKPFVFWNAGCQIVALNYQTDDKPNLFNRALFRDNGGSGYVLKPEFLRNPTIKYSPRSPSGLNPKQFPYWRIDIQVLSGQNLPRPKGSDNSDIIDPYVKCRIRGHPDDVHGGNKGETEHVRNNGFNPNWKQGNFSFLVKVPMLAFLEVKVKDHSTTGDNKCIATFCCRVKMLQEGYRRVPLEDYSGRRLSPASLLMRIKITEEE